jgi:hypothetical protein
MIYPQDVTKVGGIVPAVHHAQLIVLATTVILVMVTVCGVVTQTTVYMIYVILPPVNVHNKIRLRGDYCDESKFTNDY